jgi:hypothetical protein
VARAFPPERLRVELEHAREQGSSFTAAWQPAVRVALRQATDERRAWRQVFSSTRRAWMAAYYGAPGASDTLSRDAFPPD